MRNNLKIMIALMLIIGGSLPASMVEIPLTELWDGADLVVTGTVSKMRSFWDESKTLIYTDVSVVVERWEKGLLDGPPPEITVRILGGEVDNLLLIVSGMPSFSIGERTTLYLTKTKDPSVFEILGGWHGKFPRSGQEVMSGYRVSGFKRIPAECRYFINSTLPSDWRTAIQNAHNSSLGWNNAGSRFRFHYSGTTTRTAPVRDGRNVVHRANHGTQFVAANFFWATSPDSVIVENDIVFNTYYPWSTTGAPNALDVWNVAAHEFGHSLCLLDLYSPAHSEMTMYGYTTYGETKKRTLETGDRDGIRYIYDRTPAAPSNLTATRSGNNVTLNWRDNADNEDGFRIERRRQGQPNFTEIGRRNPNIKSYYDPGLARGYTYFYRVRAFNGSLNSSYSNTVSIHIPTSGRGVAGEEIAAASQFILISPNPVGTKTELRYIVPGSEAKHTSLRIYNVTGQVVRTLVNGNRTGENSVVWDAKDDHGRKVPAGVYIAKLQVGDSTKTTRLTLIK